MLSRRVVLLVAILVLAAASLPAQRVSRRMSHPGRGGARSGGYWGNGGGLVPPLYAPSLFDSGYGYGGFGGYGGFNGYGLGYGYSPYYSAHYPPYSPPFWPPPQYTVTILEATHDWRYWSPTTRVIVGPVAEGSDPRTIGMGVPKWAVKAEPLGDIARRYRQSAPTRQPALFIIRNQ